MAAVRNGNFSLDEVLNQNILYNNCVERLVDYLQKVMEALGPVASLWRKAAKTSRFSWMNVPSKMKLYSKLMILWIKCATGDD
jgi:hypothetical protein